MDKHPKQQISNRFKPTLTIELVWQLSVIAGLILRLRQYLSNRSLWADEASLALNLVNRTFSGLTRLLDYHQAAPIGFLFIEKVSMLVFGNSEYSLRFFPLLAGLLSVYLTYRLAREYLGLAGLFAVVMFALNSWLIYYSSELKQYSSDVAIALLLIYLASRWFKEDTNVWDPLRLAMAGVVTIWISHIAIFILAAIGIALLIDKIIQKDYRILTWLICLGLAWLISFGVEYLVSLRYVAADEYFVTYWQRAFLPLPPWNNVHWYILTYYRFLLILLNRTDPFFFYLTPTLIVIGSISLFLRSKSLILVIVISLVMTLIASALQKYPLTYRFMLFLIPLSLLPMTYGVRTIYEFLAKLKRSLALVLTGSLVVPMLWYSISIAYQGFIFPQSMSEIKPVMKYIGENNMPDDLIYVYYGSGPSFMYYAPFYHLETGNIVIAPDESRKKIALKNFYDDVNRLKGNKRVWFIFSDIVDCDGCEGDPRLFFEGYLNDFGIMLDQVEAKGAAGYLYDLSR